MFSKFYRKPRVQSERGCALLELIVAAIPFHSHAYDVAAGARTH